MDRWDKLRKTARNKLLNQMMDEHPEMTCAEIAKEFNISKQRVSELRNIELENRKQEAAVLEQTTAQ